MKKELSELASSTKKPLMNERMEKETKETGKMLLEFDGVQRHQESGTWRIEFAGGHPEIDIKDSEPWA